MSENEKIINKIVADFETAIGQFEMRDLFAEIYGKNPPTAQEIYNRQKQQNRTRLERQETLKRILWLNLGTEDEQKKMLKPAAEKAIEEALKEAKKMMNSLNLEFDVEF